MRVGIACVMQESNTFAATNSTIEDFSVQRGDEIIANRGTNTEIGGFIDGIAHMRAEAVPVLSAWAIAGGPIEDASFDRLVDDLLHSIQGVRLDALLLALHGAWVGRSHTSADAELLRRVRFVMGPDFPIVVTLDYHANVTPTLIEQVQTVIGYRTYPHVDMAETGRKAAHLLGSLFAENIRPYAYWLPIPLIAAAQIATTDRAPIADIMAELDVEFGPRKALSSSFFCVQPWLDLNGVASSFVVFTESPDPNVPTAMRNIAQRLWDRRNELELDWVQPESLLPLILRAPAVIQAFRKPSCRPPSEPNPLLALAIQVWNLEVARQARWKNVGCQNPRGVGGRVRVD